MGRRSAWAVRVADRRVAERPTTVSARSRNLCGLASLLVTAVAVAVASALVSTTLSSVPLLWNATLVYLAFLTWGLMWLVLVTGWQRLASTDS